MCSLRIGVTHVIDDGDGERSGVSSTARSGKGQYLRWRCAIATRDLVEVGRSRAQAADLDIMEVFRTDGDLLGFRARRGSPVTGRGQFTARFPVGF